MIHNISYRVFVHATENEDKVLEALRTIIPNAKPEKEEIEGHHHNPILVMKEKITDKKTIKKFIETMKEIGKEINNDLENMIDNHANLFLRFDKQEAYKGRIKLTTHGDAIHIKAKIKAYPAKKSVAIKKLREFLTNEVL
ncbi:Protein of unknown function DUF54 [Methanothermus fervidus DSM 2088]|uniref:Exosome subunit n=1 Tax=Methanothermus fervidus (strain ATCC 43054 / DSM 2088 / JCM 10308 / V24 S) TaxID=523846 RepID=E3GZ85_METFV|nr:RNA-binding protein [Methanothermus fervidus]ADP77617.1 Protein of unknown function DUF54 [Methanothermus fervidus DSM 2088]